MGSQTRMLRLLDQQRVVPGADDYPSDAYERGMQFVRVIEWLNGLGDVLSEYTHDWLHGELSHVDLVDGLVREQRELGRQVAVLDDLIAEARAASPPTRRT